MSKEDLAGLEGVAGIVVMAEAEEPIEPTEPDYGLVELREAELKILKESDGAFYIYVLTEALKAANLLRNGIGDDQAKDLETLRLAYLNTLYAEALADFNTKTEAKYDGVVPRPGARGGA